MLQMLQMLMNTVVAQTQKSYTMNQMSSKLALMVMLSQWKRALLMNKST